MNHIQVYNRSMQRVAVLNRAYKISYTKEINNVWLCSFKLSLNDPKNKEVIAKHFIELYDHEKRIGMFVVNPQKTVKNESDNSITYNCEHVLSTLHSDVLFGYYQYSNLTTRDVLQALINQQEVKHWKLGQVDFTRYFHYGWENEDSLLNAIVSVPKSFNDSYMWTWDDTSYPFTLNLVRPTDEKVDIVRFGKNLKGIEKDIDPTGIVTRIYPLGYGEGVNQLTITSVNKGIPYLQAEPAIIAEYGIHKQIWADKRFEDAQSLKESAQALLDKNKHPQVTVALDCIDYELIDPYKVTKYDIGKILEIYDEDTDTNMDLRIMKITKSDVYGSPSDIQFEIGNVRADIGTTITDLQKKQLVNDTYSQGATNIDSRDFQDNCDSEHPAIIRFPIPDDVVNINQMLLTFETQKFRAYERAIKGGGAIVSSTSAGGAVVKSTSSGGAVVNSTSSGGGSTQTSSSGGGSTQTSSSGGGVSKSTLSGGGSTQSSTFSNPTFFIHSSDPFRMGDLPPYEDHVHVVQVNDQLNHSHNVNIPAHTHNFEVPSHTHSVNTPAHTHDVSIPAHTHQINIPNHVHDIDIPAHTHDITLPDHTHDIEFGIFELNQIPSRITIEVDGNVVSFNETSGENIDLVPYLAKDDGGRIQRGRYAEIKLTPDSLARINATVTSRLFIQSRIGGNY